MKPIRSNKPEIDEFYDAFEPDDDFSDDEKDKERKKDYKDKKDKEAKDKKDKKDEKDKQNELTLHKMHQQYKLKKALQLVENVNKRKAFDKMKPTDIEKAEMRNKHNEEDRKRHLELNKTPGKTTDDMQKDMDKWTKRDQSLEELINSTKKILDASKEKMITE